MGNNDSVLPPRLFRTEQLAILRIINAHGSAHKNGVQEVTLWTCVHKDKVLLPHGRLQFPLQQLLLSLVKEGYIEKANPEYNAGYCVTAEGRNIIDRAFDRRSLQPTQPTMQAVIPNIGLTGRFGVTPAPQEQRDRDDDGGSHVIRMVTPPFLLQQVAAMMDGKKTS